MEYILKNKDREVLRFEVIYEVEKFGDLEKQISYLNEVSLINPTILPLEITTINLKSTLEKWIKNRKIPKNRQFVNKILESSGILSDDNFIAYIDISFGLSLNDSFWITPSDKNYKWAKNKKCHFLNFVIMLTNDIIRNLKKLNYTKINKVQVGEYLDEDDIVRVEDDFKR